MKYLVAVIVVSMALFLLVSMAGAIWGGVNMVAPCYGGISNYSIPERIAGGAIFGAMVFSVYGGIPAAIVGTLAGPIATWVISRKRATRTVHPR